MSAVFRTKSKAVPLLTVVLLSLVMIPTVSMATVYECEKKHNNSWWTDEAHKSNPSKLSKLSFDDETGVFWFNVGTPRSGSKLLLKQRFATDGSGKIVAARENEWGDEVLIIKPNQNKKGLLFVFMTEDDATTGPCRITEVHQNGN